MGLFHRDAGKNKFTGTLDCPICRGSAMRKGEMYDPRTQVWKLTGYIRPTCARYICKKCGTPVRYDFTNRLSPKEVAYRGLIT